jgi:hypothetical protein
MPDSLVDRLRVEDPETGLRHSIASEAADYIDTLNAAFVAYATETMNRTDELEAALLRVVEWAESHGLYADEEAQLDPVFANARAALEGKDES